MRASDVNIYLDAVFILIYTRLHLVQVSIFLVINIILSIQERTQRGPALFAPVHDLSRQIQILNAYCREAEFLGDALHGTMWDLLDEMIEIHAKLAQKSLFAGMSC